MNSNKNQSPKQPEVIIADVSWSVDGVPVEQWIANGGRCFHGKIVR